MEDPRDVTRSPSNDPALSLPIAARRPWALIVVVLLIDLGLAGAGIWMLAHGLGDRPSRTAPTRSGELDPRGPFPSVLARHSRVIHSSARRVARLVDPAGTSPSPLSVPAGAAPSPSRPS
jgi:hypothetical protein